jgi:hypothetical protein
MAINEPQFNTRLRRVPWRDLVALRPAEVGRELLLPLPWLAGSLVMAGWGYYSLALGLSFVFFLTGLRVVRGAFHYALGLPRLATEIVLLVFSQLMLGSMHAVRWNHLRHHRHCLGEDDIEAMGARRSAWGAIRLGPVFPLRLHRAALAAAPQRERRWIIAELAGNPALVTLVAGDTTPPVGGLSAAGDGGGAVPDGLLRGMDGAPRLCPNRPAGADDPASAARRDHLQHVLPLRATPVPACADGPPAAAGAASGRRVSTGALVEGVVIESRVLRL